MAYEITKALFDNIDDFWRLHPDFATLVPRDMVPDARGAPLHAEAARYYRARGWLPEARVYVLGDAGVEDAALAFEDVEPPVSVRSVESIASLAATPAYTAKA